MGITLDRCLSPEAHGPVGSRAWVREIFRRAYAHVGGPFTRVAERAELGFSTLVSLPGSLMDAAADHLVGKSGGAGAWKVAGKYPGPGGSMDEVWNDAAVPDRDGPAAARPTHMVVKNLDRLYLDNNGGVMQNPAVQYALFSLLEGIRGMVTVGLADRTFGPLPGSVVDAFDEKVTLEGVDLHQFWQLIPTPLFKKLVRSERDELPEGTALRVATRLRFCDPVRAVRLMLHVADTCAAGNEKAILEELARATRPVEFAMPDKGAAKKPQGVYKDTLDQLEGTIVTPYQKLAAAAGSGEYEDAMKVLPPGVILTGPPGTGKTHLARWAAARLGLPLRVVSGASLRDSRFGQTERNVVRLFAEARQAAPCLLVFDDADDLLPDRNTLGGSTAGADSAVVNTFLQELDGFGGRVAGVLTVLTTNRGESIDPAVVSRLGNPLRVPYPTDNAQIGELIDTFAGVFKLTLGPGARDRLIELFRGWSRPPSKEKRDRGEAYSPPDTPQARYDENECLFGPREIQQAVRTCAAWAKGGVLDLPLCDRLAALHKPHG